MKADYLTLRLIAVLLVLCLVLMLFYNPSLWLSREEAEKEAEECRRILSRIKEQKLQWALFYSVREYDIPTREDLLTRRTLPDKIDPSRTYEYRPNLLSEIPTCPSGYQYTLNAAAEEPECRSGLSGHVSSPAPR